MVRDTRDTSNFCPARQQCASLRLNWRKKGKKTKGKANLSNHSGVQTRKEETSNIILRVKGSQRQLGY